MDHYGTMKNMYGPREHFLKSDPGDVLICSVPVSA